MDFRVPGLSAAISIHAPRVGSDDAAEHGLFGFTQFQSTLPVWGATIFSYILTHNINISIHAPRVGSDDKHRQGGIG